MDTALVIGLSVGGGLAILISYLMLKAVNAVTTPAPNVPKFVATPAADVMEVAEKELDGLDTPEAIKHRIREWKLARKELRQNRVSLAKDMRAIRATHTERVRLQTPMLRGGGGVGKFVRGAQTLGRHAQRVQLAADLAPREEKLQALDDAIAKLEQCILAGERRLLTLKE